MSFRRHLGFAVNQNTYLDNRVTDFNNTPMRTLDLLVRRNASIAGDLAVGGNLSVGGDLRATNFYATGNYYLDNYVLIPAGTIIMSATVVEPAGWMHCDGRLLAKTEYPDLWMAILNTYTDISSSTHFKIPDMQGRCAIGSGSGSGLSSRPLGTYGGEEEHALSTSEMPSHSHSGTTDVSGTHTHSINDPGHTHAQTTINDDFNNSGTNPPGFSADSAGSRTWNNISTSTTGITLNSNGAHSHTFTTGTTGSGDAHNNMQPYMVVRYLIKF